MTKKRRKSGPRARQERMLAPGEDSITREVDYIIQLAQHQEGRIVTLGALVLFSTATGDAWLLDPADRYALCLARDGVRQSVRIMETAARFAIEWDRTFAVQGDAFTSTARSGRTTTVLGYPVREIQEAIEVLRRKGLLAEPQG